MLAGPKRCDPPQLQPPRALGERRTEVDRVFEGARESSLCSATPRKTLSELYRNCCEDLSWLAIGQSRLIAPVFDGFNGGIDGFIQSTRLRWVERGLYSSGIQGEHSVSALKNSLFSWQLTYSRSSRKSPSLLQSSTR